MVETFEGRKPVPNFVLPVPDEEPDAGEARLAQVLKVAAHAVELLRLGATLRPPPTLAPRHNAVLVGHAVRGFKLYDNTVFMAVGGRGEGVRILSRCLIEWSVNFRYLLKRADPDTFEAYRKYELCHRKEMLADVEREIANSSRVTDLAYDIRRRLEAGIAESGCRKEEIAKDRQRWDKFKPRVEEVHGDEALTFYTFEFGMTSGYAHGDMFDLMQHHVQCQDGQEPRPTLEPARVVPGELAATSVRVLDAAADYARVAERGSELCDELVKTSGWFGRFCDATERVESRRRDPNRTPRGAIGTFRK